MAAPLILASASSSRHAILRGAGLIHEIHVSEVDESSATGSAQEQVTMLAKAKATAVAAHYATAIIIGCDSLLEVDGVAYGKPSSAEMARARWREMGGSTGTLVTGHCLISRPDDRCVEEVVATRVTFARPSHDELDRYLATGESLGCAGGFTLEGFSAPFVTHIEGDALNVMGISPAAIRRLLGALGVNLMDYWPTLYRAPA